MPLETFRGGDVPSLLERARATIGADATLVSVRRLPRGQGFELTAADPATARAFGPAPPPFGAAAALAHPARAALDAPGAPRARGGAVRIALVGPTGAGKTTTLAKLASHPRVFGSRSPGVLCLDTYRIGAIEQSRAFAELARIPHETAWSARDLDPALRRLAGCDVLLVDTAGRGPRQRADLEATFDQLRRVMPQEIHLVLPAGLAAKVARRVVAEYRALGITHLLATKCDEAPGDGTPFDLALEHGIPMRWYTDGQEVPADLRAATLATRAARSPAALTAEVS